jgi:pimeloyl-ACP methyl ester carboxylesterase
MESLRKYGERPYRVVVLHGGPGTPGEMAPVARRLARTHGVLEPLQTEPGLEEQLQALKDALLAEADLPVRLVGHSWGAMLAFIFTARNPSMVDRLIMVSSAVFADSYAADVFRTRAGRLTAEETEEVSGLLRALGDPCVPDKDRVFAELGTYIRRADSLDLLSYKDEVTDYRYDVYERVWGDAAGLRSSGGLLELAGKIRCPVVAIHGDYDPHPAAGVIKPLSPVLKDLRFILLEECGHEPWLERRAHREFFDVLERELRDG